MKLKISIILLIISSSLGLFAQDNKTISGTVISTNGDGNIPGVTIYFKTKGLSSITNSDGKFIIALPAPFATTDSLTFSSIGYKSKTIAINKALKENTLVIKLDDYAENLHEVTIARLSLKEVLDSVKRQVNHALVKPMKLSGYYRELVFTNGKCSEYADALAEYFLDQRTKKDGQFKILASRCKNDERAVFKGDSAVANLNSKISPNHAFQLALVSRMIDRYFPIKTLSDYKYKQEQADEKDGSDIKITISPKDDAVKGIYKLVLNLTSDFVLKSFHMEIPDKFVEKTPQRNILGLHGKPYKLIFDVNYIATPNGIYPSYYSIIGASKLWGKFLGTIYDQTVEFKTEFLVTKIDQSADLKPFPGKEVYSKGNICKNGVAMNDNLLKEYTTILPSQKDTISIKPLIK
ncbi:carboxypeptidase-like regulatory domain-containing protein [Pedobacter nototheniae]|uniref:carboxypeptidase-like regulatory domain-containing protein n=1 Tax=Pedobacter nototheniae TaxID=2488994 RepID=UPI00103CD509|nr:carboxypeptidase-like regulatory domain-containing protein [Pedobacter nototheniae]